MIWNSDIEKKCKHYRISKDEYIKINELLGHAPEGLEWALFSALWSEHCSYKSSKIHLRKFSYKNSKVLEAEGENAGIIDLGGGERVAFKMESHNHPSFIEPFQGAATGVGGILRDIFTMGARPIALADYLCFGEPKAERMKSLVSGVVHGISSYGNCVGVPNVTGQVESEPEYNKNILVNAMAVGLLTPEMSVTKSVAAGPGNWIVYVGAKTGKDGVHGASMASESFGENSEAKKPNVQIGDPFFEKLLIEACLEIIEQDLVVAMQDMGAAGLTSSTFEMAAKGGVGFRMDLSKVPLRDSSLTPEEILLSESQERMLLICEPQKFPEIEKVFKRWGLDAAVIGTVTDPKSGVDVELFWQDQCLVKIDPNIIIEGAPRYERPFEKNVKHNSSTQTLSFRETSLSEHMQKQFETNHGASKSWVTKQYDQRVGLRTARDTSSSCAFLRLPSGRALSVMTGCRPSVMKINPRLGALDAILFPSLQMAVKGAESLAVTDCLNFGNPEKINVMSDFVTSVEALAEASRWLEAPVISGNVSFYNETLGENIIPTPATGLVGLRASVENIPADEFLSAGESVFWIRQPRAMAHLDQKIWTGDCGPETTQQWVRLIQAMREGSEFFASSRVCGSLGFWSALWKMCRGGFGFELRNERVLKIPQKEFLQTAFYEVVVSIKPDQLSEFLKWSAKKSEGLFEVVEIGLTSPREIRWGSEKIEIQKIKNWEESSWKMVWGLS